MFKKISRRTFIKIAAAGFALAAAKIFYNIQAVESCPVQTRYGIFNGFVDKQGVKTWLGIPYAKPPVGNLRWRAPEPLEPSDKTFDAKKFGASAIQDHDPIEPASMHRQSEDCLTLNIWTRGAGKNLPVMIFIHGGGFLNGGSADPLYNCSNLAAAHDVVFVTINYRLNVFGFMNFAAIDSSFEDTGCLGLKDQIAALTWVKENIADFGGNPDNMTVFGESAGAISVSLLMVTPAAHGLFQKAIAQSGHAAYYYIPDASAKLAKEFMFLSGCKNMAELMKKSSDELRADHEKFCAEEIISADTNYLPTCYGKFLPAHPLLAFKEGAARGIKLLTGTMEDEYLYWGLYFDDVSNQLPKYHEALTPVLYEGEFSEATALYQTWQKNHMDLDEVSRYIEFADQLDWRVGQELMAEYQSAFDDVYFYLFNQQSPVAELESCHALDLPFVFNNPSEGIEPNPSPKLVKQVQAAWCSFAASGDPNNEFIPHWKKYSVADRQTMEINSNVWTCRKDLNVANLSELRGVYENHLLN
ncbi:MAG: carboxylesterase family protein [Selenomonadaceae bacterium]|nr:carboxylesterase family protein [Selenomonadaceae bacterium]MBQ9497048.1 carboxylesterase family protein [Selenomonadaceae bacterium]